MDKDDMRSEIHRLKVKCNNYAYRLVNLGVDDVEWEATKTLFNNFKYYVMCKSCSATVKQNRTEDEAVILWNTRYTEEAK